MAAQLRVEALEPRDVPATFGTPWPDGEHLTLSFAPDGTSVLGAASDLTAHDPNARLAVLCAFQAWAVNANLNVGLVTDSGAAFGTGGAEQGDPRFGDVRIGGRALAPDVLAVTAPYQRFDNYSGEIVLNTAAHFGAGGYDLLTAVLQEAGHALGVANSPEMSSAMYEYYQGARTGLSAGDIASIRALYGARQPDKYEGANGNDTLATANAVPAGPVTADLTTAADVDVYEFTAGAHTDRVTVNLRAAGLSLVTTRVELLDAAGHVLATGTATDPTRNDITLSLGAVRPGLTYFVRVSAARGDEFAVGSYELEVTQSTLPATDAGSGTSDMLVSTHDRLQSELAAGAGESTPGAETFQVVVPPSNSGEPVNLLLTVWSADGRAVNPWIVVTDAHGRTFGADVMTADGNTTTVLVRGLQAGETYFVKASSDSPSAGGLHFAADLHAQVAPVPELAAGGLNPGAETRESFALAQSGQIRLVLTATGADGAAEAVVTDAAGREVGRFAAESGYGRSLDVFLSAGTYTVTVRAVGEALLDFRLGLALVTDPIGVRPEDPTSAPPALAPPPPPNPIVAQPLRPQTARPPVVPVIPIVPPQPAPVRPSAPTLVPPGSVPPRQPMSPPAVAPQLPGSPTSALVWGKTRPAEPIEYAWWY